MKKYLYVYSDCVHGENEKEIIHSVPSWKLKNSTKYKEADGRRFLTVYRLDEWLENRKFIEKLQIG